MNKVERKPRKKGIYLLPNLLTTGALFSGFYAIIAATADRFEHAAIAIVIAMLLDGFDGRVARMTDTQLNSVHSTTASQIWCLLE